MNNSYLSNKQFKELENQLISFLESGKIYENSIHYLIKWFCISNGKSNDHLHKYVKDNSETICDFNQSQSFIKNDFVDNALISLIKNGFYNFGAIIPIDKIDLIVNHLNSTRCFYFKSGFKYHLKSIPVKFTNSDRISFEEKNLLKSWQILQLVTDPSILRLAYLYLGCAPVLSNVSSWISYASKFVNAAESAQEYHFDMDRIKWIKFFVYLNDVNQQNGPHCYVRKTHLTGSHPKELRKKGYSRISDKLIKKYFIDQDIIEFEGRAGTLIAVDTRGYHKGKVLMKGSRKILQLEYANSLFGGFCSKLVSQPLVEHIKNREIKLSEHIYQKYI